MKSAWLTLKSAWLTLTIFFFFACSLLYLAGRGSAWQSDECKYTRHISRAIHLFWHGPQLCTAACAHHARLSHGDFCLSAGLCFLVTHAVLGIIRPFLLLICLAMISWGMSSSHPLFFIVLTEFSFRDTVNDLAWRPGNLFTFYTLKRILVSDTAAYISHHHGFGQWVHCRQQQP